jgi:biotin carboxyl carrier protein
MLASTPRTRDYSIPVAEQIGAEDMVEIKVTSDLNAIVWKIEVTAGAVVNAGDTLMILEAMKMEIPVASPRAGNVQSLLVKEGQQVAEGQPLVVLLF